MKTPLLLVPGHLCDAAMWAHQTRHLADLADMTVASTLGGNSLALMAGAILAKAPQRFALAGLSMGGALCFEILRQAPGRVARLALLDTMAAPNTPPQIERRHRHMDFMRTGRFDRVVDEFKPMLVHPDRLADAPLMEALDAMLRRIGPQAGHDQQQALLDRIDYQPLLPGIAVPTLVMCGRQDALTALAQHEAMARAIPGARLVVIEDSGHMTTMERPQAVTAVLRYWLQA